MRYTFCPSRTAPDLDDLYASADWLIPDLDRLQVYAQDVLSGAATPALAFAAAHQRWVAVECGVLKEWDNSPLVLREQAPDLKAIVEETAPGRFWGYSWDEPLTSGIRGRPQPRAVLFEDWTDEAFRFVVDVCTDFAQQQGDLGLGLWNWIIAWPNHPIARHIELFDAVAALTDRRGKTRVGYPDEVTLDVDLNSPQGHNTRRMEFSRLRDWCHDRAIELAVIVGGAPPPVRTVHWREGWARTLRRDLGAWPDRLVIQSWADGDSAVNLAHLVQAVDTIVRAHP